MAAGAGDGGLAIPAKLAATVVAWEGEPGRRWLDRLPHLVAEVADAWGLDVGSPFEPGGYISWVAPARRRSDGMEVVLKVQHPHPESEPEAAALRAWGGAGAVLLLEHDAERWALLLERCRPGTSLADEGGSLAAARAGAALGARLHAAPPPGGVPSLESVLIRWADEVEHRSSRQGPWIDPALVAMGTAVMRSPSPRQVVLHGDLNPTNVLSAQREPWLAIDPKPMIGDPARDGARLVLQPDPRGLDEVRARLTVVADELGVDEGRLAEWCVADAVEMAISARATSDPERADRCAAQAAMVARIS
jgi:streptomycin 6-kinase